LLGHLGPRPVSPDLGPVALGVGPLPHRNMVWPTCHDTTELVSVSAPAARVSKLCLAVKGRVD
jgi:hypothetical protein